ncbi:hypothetical protein [Bifidobacterium commune]|nr:hypothetical protein [Bifidobacterium commune]
MMEKGAALASSAVLHSITHYSGEGEVEVLDGFAVGLSADGTVS